MNSRWTCAKHEGRARLRKGEASGIALLKERPLNEEQPRGPYACFRWGGGGGGRQTAQSARAFQVVPKTLTPNSPRGVLVADFTATVWGSFGDEGLLGTFQGLALSGI